MKGEEVVEAREGCWGHCGAANSNDSRTEVEAGFGYGEAETCNVIECELGQLVARCSRLTDLWRHR